MKISCVSVLLIAVTPSCAAVTVATSQDVLGPERSRAVVGATALDAARLVTPLFGSRGYALSEQHSAGSGLALRFTGDRQVVVSGSRGTTGSTQLGSEFRVAVTPSPTGALVEITGRPTQDRAVICARPAEAHCTDFGRSVASDVDGVAEAIVVRGVFAELALDGAVVPTTDAVMAAPGAEAAPTCLELRHAIFTRAQQLTDAGARARLLRSAPECHA